MLIVIFHNLMFVGGLANYTPTTLIDFQLGLSSKVTGGGGQKWTSSSKSGRSNKNESNHGNGLDSSLIMDASNGTNVTIKPASSEETASWSTSSNASDLLF